MKILGDIGIERLLSGMVLLFLFVKRLWVPMLASVLGSYTSMWYETDFMRRFPEFWSMLYSPDYVARALYHAELTKQVF